MNLSYPIDLFGFSIHMVNCDDKDKLFQDITEDSSREVCIVNSRKNCSKLRGEIHRKDLTFVKFILFRRFLSSQRIWSRRKAKSILSFNRFDTKLMAMKSGKFHSSAFQILCVRRDSAETAWEKYKCTKLNVYSYTSTFYSLLFYSFEDDDDPFMVTDLGDVIDKYTHWQKKFTRVKPFYGTVPSEVLFAPSACHSGHSYMPYCQGWCRQFQWHCSFPIFHRSCRRRIVKVDILFGTRDH